MTAKTGRVHYDMLRVPRSSPLNLKGMSMRMIKFFFKLQLVVLLAVPCFADEVEHGLDDKLAMYSEYLGYWESEVNGKATDLNPEAYTSKDSWFCSAVLGGRAIMMRGTNKIDGETSQYLWLLTYDEALDSYVGWYHDSFGINSKLIGSWSEVNNKMTWSLADPAAWGMTVTAVDDMSNPGQLSFSFKVKTKDGETVIDQSGIAKQVEAPEKAVVYEAKKAGEKLKMFTPYTGRWVATIKGRGVEEDQTFNLQSHSDARFIFDGLIFELQGTTRVEDADVHTYQLFTYDQREETYVMYFHDSNGVHAKMYMKWSEDRNEFSLEPEGAEDMDVEIKSTIQFVDERLIRSTFEVTDEDGMILMSQTTTAKREQVD